MRPTNIIVGDLIGQGSFGSVFQAQYEDQDKAKVDSALKISQLGVPKKSYNVTDFLAWIREVVLGRYLPKTDKRLQSAVLLPRYFSLSPSDTPTGLIDPSLLHGPLEDLLKKSRDWVGVSVSRRGGESLQQWRRSRTPTAVLNVLKTVTEIVERLHAVGVAHQDLSLTNILITEDGEPELIDFGGAAFDRNNALVDARIQQEFTNVLSLCGKYIRLARATRKTRQKPPTEVIQQMGGIRMHEGSIFLDTQHHMGLPAILDDAAAPPFSLHRRLDACQVAKLTLVAYLEDERWQVSGNHHEVTTGFSKVDGLIREVFLRRCTTTAVLRLIDSMLETLTA